MKKLLLLPVLFLFISCGITNSTPVSISPISSKINVSGEQNELYVRANNWMVGNFTDAKSVIQFSDKEEGIVTGKYLLRSTYEFSGLTAVDRDIYAIIKIQLKDGASKITIKPDKFLALTSGTIQQSYQFGEDEVRRQIEDLLYSFEIYMNNDTSSDW